MAIPVECPKCNTPASLPDSTAGKTVRCKCATAFQVPSVMLIDDLELQAPKLAQAAQQSVKASNTPVSALKCTSCGSNLQIPANVDHYDCTFCKTTFSVRRQDGVVSLIADAVRKVQVGTDKTAAELSLPRLRKDLAGFQNRLSLIRGGQALPILVMYVVAFVISVSMFGGLAITGSLGLGVLSAAVIWMVVILVARSVKNKFRTANPMQDQIDELEAQIKDLKHRVAQAQKIVDG